MGDLITYAIFLKAFFKLMDSPFDIKRPGIVLMTSLTYLYILMNRVGLGGLWFLDLVMFLLASMFLGRAYGDEDGRPPNWALTMMGVAGLILVGVAVRNHSGGSSASKITTGVAAKLLKQGIGGQVALDREIRNDAGEGSGGATGEGSLGEVQSLLEKAAKDGSVDEKELQKALKKALSSQSSIGNQGGLESLTDDP